MSPMPEHRGCMQDYESYLGSLKQRVRAALPGVRFLVGNVSLGGGTGLPVVSVQGEFVDRVRDLFRGNGNVSVEPLSREMYDLLSGK